MCAALLLVFALWQHVLPYRMCMCVCICVRVRGYCRMLCRHYRRGKCCPRKKLTEALKKDMGYEILVESVCVRMCLMIKYASTFSGP